MPLTPRYVGEFSVRPMEARDIPTFLELIQALADYEKLPGPSREARERLARDAASSPPRFSVLLAERGGRVVGYAVYFETYSTFLAQPSLFLEDLFVLEEERNRGAGRAIFRELAREAVRRGCGRLEWQVLAWNAPSIAFYQGIGGKHIEDWYSYRMTAEAFSRLAEE